MRLNRLIDNMAEYVFLKTANQTLSALEKNDWWN